jgi:polysaccharide biosynthesis transport protein
MTAEQSPRSLPQRTVLPADAGSEGGLDLSQVVDAIRRKIFLIAGITTVVASAAMVKALTETPTYQAQFQILTQPVTVEGQVISSVPQTLTSREATTQVTLDDTKLRVLTSPRIIEPIVQQLESRYPGMSYGALVGSLGIAAIGQNTNILEVRYRSTDPEQVKAILEVVSKAYLDYSLASRQADIRRGIDFVEKQLPDLENRVKELQEELQQLRQRYNLVDPDARGEQLSGQINTFGQQQLDTQAQLSEARASYLDLQRQLASQPSESIASPALVTDARYQSLLNQLLAVDSQIAQQSALYLPDSPDMQVLRDQRANLLPLLQREGQRVQSEVASQIRALEARNQALQQTLDGLNRDVNQLSSIDRQYTDIERELQIATDNLSQFLAKREALRIDAAQRETPWELLTPPGEPQPSSASVKRNLVLGTVLGLLLGIGVALVLDKMSTLLYTVKDVKRVARLPILGTIPFCEDIEQLLPASELPMLDVANLLKQVEQHQFTHSNGSNGNGLQPYETSPFLESFRSLNASIRLIRPDARVRSLVLSSAMPGEGKSTIATQLAYAAAAMEQRVLLVDTDLRRPQIHSRLGLPNHEGLTDVISTNFDLMAAVKRSPVENNLFVLTAGSIAPDPTKVLASERMEEVMKQALAAFDLVIYDAPPLLGFADPYLITKHTDGLLLIVGLGKLKQYWLEQAIEELEVSGVSVLGAVANGSKEQLVNSYSSYYRNHAPSSEIQSMPQEAGESVLKSLLTSAFSRSKRN